MTAAIGVTFGAKSAAKRILLFAINITVLLLGLTCSVLCLYQVKLMPETYDVIVAAVMESNLTSQAQLQASVEPAMLRTNTSNNGRPRVSRYVGPRNGTKTTIKEIKLSTESLSFDTDVVLAGTDVTVFNTSTSQRIADVTSPTTSVSQTTTGSTTTVSLTTKLLPAVSSAGSATSSTSKSNIGDMGDFSQVLKDRIAMLENELRMAQQRMNETTISEKSTSTLPPATTNFSFMLGSTSTSVLRPQSSSATALGSSSTTSAVPKSTPLTTPSASTSQPTPLTNPSEKQSTNTQPSSITMLEQPHSETPTTSATTPPSATPPSTPPPSTPPPSTPPPSTPPPSTPPPSTPPPSTPPPSTPPETPTTATLTTATLTTATLTTATPTTATPTTATPTTATPTTATPTTKTTAPTSTTTPTSTNIAIATEVLSTSHPATASLAPTTSSIPEPFPSPLSPTTLSPTSTLDGSPSTSTVFSASQEQSSRVEPIAELASSTVGAQFSEVWTKPQTIGHQEPSKNAVSTSSFVELESVTTEFASSSTSVSVQPTTTLLLPSGDEQLKILPQTSSTSQKPWSSISSTSVINPTVTSASTAQPITSTSPSPPTKLTTTIQTTPVVTSTTGRSLPTTVPSTASTKMTTIPTSSPVFINLTGVVDSVLKLVGRRDLSKHRFQRAVTDVPKLSSATLTVDNIPPYFEQLFFLVQTSLYVCTAAGLLIFFSSLAGICGGLFRIEGCLKFSVAALVLVIMAEMATTAFIFIAHDKASNRNKNKTFDHDLKLLCEIANFCVQPILMVITGSFLCLSIVLQIGSITLACNLMESRNQDNPDKKFRRMMQSNRSDFQMTAGNMYNPYGNPLAMSMPSHCCAASGGGYAAGMGSGVVPYPSSMMMPMQNMGYYPPVFSGQRPIVNIIA